jgi:hypothetical protein
MVEEKKTTGMKSLLVKAVRHIRSVFRAYDERTRKAAIMRVPRWWKAKLDDGPENKILTLRTRYGRKQVQAKTLQGRGRKCGDRVIALFSDLYEFHSLHVQG